MTDLGEPIFALVGTAMGAVGAYLGTRKFEEFRLQREENARERERRDELQVAVRALRADLEQALTRIERAIEKERYWSEDLGLPIELWDEHRNVVARDLPAEEWGVIHNAFRLIRVQETRAGMAHDREPDEDRPKLSDFAAKQFRITIRQVKKALDALAGSEARLTPP